VSFERVSVEVQVVAYVHVVVVTPASPSALALLGGRELEANALVAFLTTYPWRVGSGRRYTNRIRCVFGAWLYLFRVKFTQDVQ